MSEPAQILAIDQGSHASRAALFAADGRRGQIAYREVATRRPREGWVEQDPEELLQSVLDCAEEVAAAAPGPITVAGLATQRSSLVCWDRDSGAALSPVLSWRDRRAAAWLEGFRDLEADISHRTGLPMSAHYGASKMAWCLAHLDTVRDAGDRLVIGPLASFLAHRLCPGSEPLVDPANASRTLLFNRFSLDWDDRLLELFSVAAASLPRCVPTRFEFGTLTAAGHDIALGLVTGDQAAAFYAGDAHALGTTVVNIGTGAFIQIAAGADALTAEGLLASIAYADGTGAQYVLEGTVNGAGNALSQVAEQLGMSPARLRSDLDPWLRTVGDPPLFLNGVGGIGSPWWQPDFVSRFIGGDGIAERMVAVCESIVFLLQVNLDRARTVVTTADIRVSGGVARSDALCQRLADLSGLTVTREQEPETTLAGVARLLGWRPPARGDRDVFEPSANRPLRDRYQRWMAAMQDALPTTRP